MSMQDFLQNFHSATTIVKATVTDKEYIESHISYGYYFDAWKGKFRWKFTKTT